MIKISILIEYYNEDLKRELTDEDKKLDYNDFSKKYLKNRMNVFSYDTRNEEHKKTLENIKSSDDLKQYLQ